MATTLKVLRPRARHCRLVSFHLSPRLPPERSLIPLAALAKSRREPRPHRQGSIPAALPKQHRQAPRLPRQQPLPAALPKHRRNNLVYGRRLSSLSPRSRNLTASLKPKAVPRWARASKPSARDSMEQELFRPALGLLTG